MDLDHQFGSDLQVGATGDLLLADGDGYVRQRVLKRLLTNLGDYLWQLGYGAGLAQFVGQPVQSDRVRAIVRSQIFKEPTVARSPEPVIEVRSDDVGDVYVDIRYANTSEGQMQILSFALGL